MVHVSHYFDTWVHCEPKSLTPAGVGWIWVRKACALWILSLDFWPFNEILSLEWRRYLLLTWWWLPDLPSSKRMVHVPACTHGQVPVGINMSNSLNFRILWLFPFYSFSYQLVTLLHAYQEDFMQQLFLFSIFIELVWWLVPRDAPVL